MDDDQEVIRDEEVPVDTLVVDVKTGIAAVINLLEQVQDGEALFHEGWPEVADRFDDLTRALIGAGMSINMDNNPIGIKIKEKLDALLVWD